MRYVGEEHNNKSDKKKYGILAQANNTQIMGPISYNTNFPPLAQGRYGIKLISEKHYKRSEIILAGKV